MRQERRVSPFVCFPLSFERDMAENTTNKIGNTPQTHLKDKNKNQQEKILYLY